MEVESDPFKESIASSDAVIAFKKYIKKNLNIVAIRRNKRDIDTMDSN